MRKLRHWEVIIQLIWVRASVWNPWTLHHESALSTTIFSYIFSLYGIWSSWWCRVHIVTRREGSEVATVSHLPLFFPFLCIVILSKPIVCPWCWISYVPGMKMEEPEGKASRAWTSSPWWWASWQAASRTGTDSQKPLFPQWTHTGRVPAKPWSFLIAHLTTSVYTFNPECEEQSQHELS